MRKLFSRMVSELLYQHLNEYNLLLLEQKGCRNSRGAKDHLLIDKLVLHIAKSKHKNLFMAWIDYRKAFDSISYKWLLRCMSLYGIHPDICRMLTT